MISFKKRLLFLATLLCTSFTFADSPVHPEPHQLTFLGGTLHLSGAAEFPTSDFATSKLLEKTLAPLPTDQGLTSLVIGTRESAEITPLLTNLPKVSGAYRLLIEPNRIVLAGHDNRGTYYAALTLRQLLASAKFPGTVPALDLSDWPEVSHRGIVEGFYGTPWPHQKRLRVIDFLGDHKLDTYIYGPKDDPYHSSPHWRDPYPAAEAAKIQELAHASRANHVDFYWAIHPGKDIKWNPQDEAKVLEKFEAMYQLGVRAFAVFFDDISGEGTRADRQAGLLNKIQNEFVLKKGDVRPLVMCPTQYNKAWSGGDYLDTLGTTLDPAIHVMWTGNTVVADLDRPSMEWINAKLRRKAYIWWNNPVTDYVRNHLLMGPIYGNSLDIGPLYGGFVSNPMERPEASKVALFGVADYTWNPEKFDSEASFLAAIKTVMPGAIEAFETFSRHNSDLGPNGHGYRRTESTHFAALAEEFLTAFREEKPANTEAIRAEFSKIKAAPAAIRVESKNELLIEEISPWLDAFAQLGTAGVAALDAHLALSEKKDEDCWTSLAQANAALAQMAEIDRTKNQNPYQPGIKTASLIVTPMVKEVVETTNARLLAALSGNSVLRLSGITSTDQRDSFPRMLDGRDDTFYYAKQIQKANDWFGLDLGGLQKVSRVRIALGRNDQDHDRLYNGVLEGSTGDTWNAIAPITEAQVDISLDPPKQFRALRVRVIKPGSPAKPDLWTAIRSFEINPGNAADLRTDLPAFASQPVRLSNNTLSISPSLEVHEFPPEKFLGLLLPEPAEVTAIEIDLKTESPEKHFAIEVSTPDQKGWQALETTSDGTLLKANPKRTIQAVRIHNRSKTSPSVTLARFAVTTAEKASDPLAALTDGLLQTTAALPSDGQKIIVPENQNSVTILTAGPVENSIEVFALASGKRQALGFLKSPFTRLPLPSGTTELGFSKSPESLSIHEIIWSSR